MKRKITLSILLLSSLASPVFAVDSAPSVSSTGVQNTSMELARQAGSIAGVLQACGQDTADFDKRILEAISQVGTDAMDKAAAMLIYKQITREAQAKETKTQTIPCKQAIDDYHRLPIMQENYKETIIQKLTPPE